jgi:hypothetical protein
MCVCLCVIVAEQASLAKQNGAKGTAPAAAPDARAQGRGESRGPTQGGGGRRQHDDERGDARDHDRRRDDDGGDRSRGRGRRDDDGDRGGGHRERERERKPIPTEPPFSMYVGNVDFDATERDLGEFFERDGVVTSVRLIKDRDGRSKGYGYVDFETSAALASALNRHNEPLLSRALRLDVADEGPSGGGGGGRGRGGARGARCVALR